MRISVRTGRRTGSITALLALAWVAGLVAACSGSAASTPGARAAAVPAGAPAQAAASAAPTSNGGGTGNGSQTGGNDLGAPLVDDTKIVRTGSLQMTVADTTKALLAGRDAIRSMGGYIGASQQQRTDDQIVATVTYRIPVARWEDALAAIRSLGTDVGEQTQAVEVTGQLVDKPPTQDHTKTELHHHQYHEGDHAHKGAGLRRSTYAQPIDAPAAGSVSRDLLP